MIAKHFGAQWEVRAYHEGKIAPERLAEQLDAWFISHVTCGEDGFSGAHFKLRYENGEKVNA